MLGGPGCGKGTRCDKIGLRGELALQQLRAQGVYHPLRRAAAQPAAPLQGVQHGQPGAGLVPQVPEQALGRGGQGRGISAATFCVLTKSSYIYYLKIAIQNSLNYLIIFKKYMH